MEQIIGVFKINPTIVLSMVATVIGLIIRDYFLMKSKIVRLEEKTKAQHRLITELQEDLRLITPLNEIHAILVTLKDMRENDAEILDGIHNIEDRLKEDEC